MITSSRLQDSMAVHWAMGCWILTFLAPHSLAAVSGSKPIYKLFSSNVIDPSPIKLTVHLQTIYHFDPQYFSEDKFPLLR